MNKKINLVVTGVFTYPRGMAGTKRVQNAITALMVYPEISTRVILQRQSSVDNALSGVHNGIPYETVMGDLLRGKMLAALPKLCYKTMLAFKKAFQPDKKNVIYFYGPLFLESVVPLYYAQQLGYKIVFDVIEDYGLTKEVSRSFYHYLRSSLSSRVSARIKNLSAGVIVISSYLKEKCRALTQGRVPLHYMPISVDMALFPQQPATSKSTVTLLYAGSFGKKDGLPVLLDAFDRLAEKHDHVRLVLTGRGDDDAMKAFFVRTALSPYKDRIEFKGYLDEADYYSLLNEADIPCMTRIDLAFANAGFPFKLGEFLATGKPVIASLVSDVEKFLTSGHNAMLVQAGSSAEVYEAVEYLIHNPESAVTIGTRGREIAESNFDIKHQGKALRTFLEEV